MKRCKKHWWHRIKIKHIYELDLRPGALNIAILDLPEIEICTSCYKVRNA